MLTKTINLCGENFTIIYDKAPFNILFFAIIITFFLLRSNFIEKKISIGFFFLLSLSAIVIANKIDTDKIKLKSSFIQRADCLEELLYDKKFVSINEIPDKSLLNYQGKDKQILEELATRYENGTANIEKNIEQAKQIRKKLLPPEVKNSSKKKGK